MKKLVLLLAIFAALFVTSCVKETQQPPQDNVLEETDTVQVDSAVLVTGIAIDGAMNSVFLKVGDDTVQFNYPDLDSDHRQSWEMGDSVTIRYYVTENGDSITDVINESDA